MDTATGVKEIKTLDEWREFTSSAVDELRKNPEWVDAAYVETVKGVFNGWDDNDLANGLVDMIAVLVDRNALFAVAVYKTAYQIVREGVEIQFTKFIDEKLRGEKGDNK